MLKKDSDLVRPRDYAEWKNFRLAGTAVCIKPHMWAYAAFAVAAPQQVGAVDLILVFACCGDDVCGAISGSHVGNYMLLNDNVNLFSDYIWK